MPYYNSVRGGVEIVCSKEQKRVMEWALSEQSRYGCLDAPKWADMPVDNYEEAEREYDKRH